MSDSEHDIFKLGGGWIDDEYFSSVKMGLSTVTHKHKIVPWTWSMIVKPLNLDSHELPKFNYLKHFIRKKDVRNKIIISIYSTSLTKTVH